MSSASRAPTEEEVVSQENYEKLHFVYWEAAPAFIRQVFHDMWERLMRSTWEDSMSFGKKLLERSAGSQILRQCKKHQMDCIKSGNSFHWDLPLLLDILKSLLPQVTSHDLLEPSKVAAMTTKNFDFLKNTRNKLAHAGQMSIDDVAFKALWEESVSVLTSLGMNSELLHKPKKLEVEPKSPEKENITENSNAKKAKEFRVAGNEFFKKQMFVEAAAEYSKGIEMEDIPRELLGLLYANRSVAKLEAKDPEGAKEDAKSCVTLRPQWSRGYARLGKAYEKLRKFEKAVLNLSIAVYRGDSSKPTVDAFDSCKLVVSRRKSSLHTDPDHLRISQDAVYNENKNLLKSYLDMSQAEKFLKGSGLDLSLTGRHYFYGSEGYPVDYERAAEFFSKAADMNDAMGLYHLAMMTQEGKGVEKNMKKGHELFLKAASQDPVKEYVKGSGRKTRNLGVAEACHAVGLAYDNGIVVKMDLRKALEWYHKALEFGNADSANNIALILLDKYAGFPLGAQKAMEYWKLSAQLGVERAIESIAIEYLHRKKFSLAQEWFHFAIHKGSIDFKSRRGEFLRDAQLEKKFDPAKFAKQLEEDVRRSNVVGHLFKKIEEFQRNFGLETSMFGGVIKPELDGRWTTRSGAIVKHRLALQEMHTYLMMKKQMGQLGLEALTKINVVAANALVTSAAVDLVGLKEIYFEEMETQKDDTVYTGRVLKVSVIEDAILGSPSVQLLVADGKGDVGRLFIYNYPQRGEETHAELGFGCRLSLMYPYFRTMADGLKGLRVDDPKLVCTQPTLRTPDSCRYCGKTDAKKVLCRKCRRVSYCSQTCLQKDANDLQHSLVCYKVIP